MMCEWPVVSLASVCDELSDGLHKAPIFDNEGEYIFVNAQNLHDGHIVDVDKSKHTTYAEFCKYGIALSERSILYSIDGTIGNMARYHGEKVVLGKGACYINVRQGVSPDYIYYQLQSDHFRNYIDNMSTGSTIRHISLKTMRGYSFALPPYEMQEKMAAVLKSVDGKIEVNNRINDNLAA